MRRTFILAGCVLAAACQPDAQDLAGPVDVAASFTEQSPVAPPDLAAERASLLAADRAFADASAATNVTQGLTAMLAEDALYQAPGGLVRGRDAARAYLARSAANAVASITWTALRADVSGDGRHGYTYGYTTITLAGYPPLPGKYIAYWERDEAGEWKVIAYKRVASPFGDVTPTAPAGFETPDDRHYRTFPHSDPAVVIEEVMARDAAFSQMSRTDGGAAAFTTFLAEDGAVLGGFPEILFGVDAVRGYYGPLAPGQLVWQPSVGEAAATGDLAFTMGPFEFRDVMPDGSLSDPVLGWYFSIWKRDRNGEWHFVIDG